MNDDHIPPRTSNPEPIRRQVLDTSVKDDIVRFFTDIDATDKALFVILPIAFVLLTIPLWW